MSGYEDDTYVRVHGAWLHASMSLSTVFISPAGEGWPHITGLTGIGPRPRAGSYGGGAPEGGQAGGPTARVTDDVWEAPD